MTRKGYKHTEKTRRKMSLANLASGYQPLKSAGE